MTLLDSIAQIDGNLLIGIQHSLNADWLTEVMKFITSFGNAGWASIVLSIALIICKKTRPVGIACAATVAITFICCSGIIKPICDRPRPWEVLDEVRMLIPDPGDSSLPSGHAANSMAFAFALWLNTRPGKSCGKYNKLHKWSYVAIVFALLIGFSRIYLGMHFPSDVIAGILIAVVFGEIVYLINIKLCSKNVIIKER